jgi:hypothetical protein
MSGLLRLCAVFMVVLFVGVIGMVVVYGGNPLYLVLLIPQLGLALAFWAIADIHEKLMAPAKDQNHPNELGSPE